MATQGRRSQHVSQPLSTQIRINCHPLFLNSTRGRILRGPRLMVAWPLFLQVPIMTDAVLVGAVSNVRRKHSTGWYVFVALLSAASLLPIVAYPFTTLVIPRDESALAVLGVLTFLGSHFHVGLTGWFYTDPVMRSHFRAQPLRYLVVPCALVGGGAALFWLHQAGFLIICLLPVIFGLAVALNESLRTNWLRLVFFLFGTLFFLPLYAFDDPVSATLGYAIAHGLQYVVFMAFVGADRRFPIASLIILAGIATIYAAFALWLVNNAAVYGSALTGVFIGLVATHFVLDAGIWKLREPFQRRYMREKFNFIFDR